MWGRIGKEGGGVGWVKGGGAWGHLKVSKRLCAGLARVILPFGPCLPRELHKRIGNR